VTGRDPDRYGTRRWGAGMRQAEATRQVSRRGWRRGCGIEGDGEEPETGHRASVGLPRQETDPQRHARCRF